MTDPEYSIPNDDISPDDVQPNADLREADLSDASLYYADLSGADLSDANLREADLSDANLREADLSDANLREADLSDANLREADLSGALLLGADLSGADFDVADLSDADLTDADLSGAGLLAADLSDAVLYHADLSDADLIDADLSNTLLVDTDFSQVALSRQTTIGSSKNRLQAEVGKIGEREYDQIARINHELRTAYSSNGLTRRARRARVRERVARRNEARAEGGWGWLEWLGSRGSQILTGYGIQLWRVVLLMSVLYLGSTLVYWGVGGMPLVESLYYSIVTFTTSPPADPAPTGPVMRVVAGVETFAGTAAIVFLGYVLGTRERV